MMPLPTLIFATNNQHKVEEIRKLIGNLFTILTLKEAGIDMDIPEPYDSLEANASAKSATIYQLTGQNCFSEDSGLLVAALNGEPGVKSARYAGDTKDFQANIDKLMHHMQGQTNRAAAFTTVISLILDGKEYLFKGTCKGNIALAQRGAGGFGYDPVFIPEGSNRTFAEMSLEEKNAISHRRKATDQLIAFLQHSSKA